MKPNEEVTCADCGREYARDPVLEVSCPICHAAVGHPCVVRRPSGHVHTAKYAGLPAWGHDARDLLAAAEGKYGCGCGVSPDIARMRLESVLRGEKLLTRREEIGQRDLFPLPSSA